MKRRPNNPRPLPEWYQKCEAPRYPVDCPDCPFGQMDMTLEEVQGKYLGGYDE